MQDDVLDGTGAEPKAAVNEDLGPSGLAAASGVEVSHMNPTSSKQQVGAAKQVSAVPQCTSMPIVCLACVIRTSVRKEGVLCSWQPLKKGW